jgi:hypothetical protein
MSYGSAKRCRRFYDEKAITFRLETCKNMVEDNVPKR